MSSGSPTTDERNVATYNDQPVQFTFLSMKDITFSASDIQELKMVLICAAACRRCCCIAVALWRLLRLSITFSV